MTAFADFDAAQDHFLAQMRSSEVVRAVAQPFSRRMAAIDSLRRVAHDDEHFMAVVRQADAARDRHDWAAAETGYAAALTLHPYERSYWVQFGHVAREQGRLARAEIAYRTACAFGEPVRVLAPFIAAVEQPGTASPSAPAGAPDGGATRFQPPGYPDLALLAGLARGTGQIDDHEALALLREGASLEAVLVTMLDAQGGAASLPEAVAVVPGTEALRPEWRDDLARLAGAGQNAFEAALARGEPPLAALRAAGGLADWALPVREAAQA
jgi:hypothetical protein